MCSNPFFSMAARVKIQQRDAELLAALHFVQKRRARLFQSIFFRMAEVDQVAVVRHDVFCAESAVFTILLEGLDAFFAQWLRPPLPLVFGEKRKSLRADLFGIDRGILDPTARAHMCSDVFHFLAL